MSEPTKHERLIALAIHPDDVPDGLARFGEMLDAMPEMDGVQTLRALRKIDPGVRVILASGYASESIHEAARAEAVDATLEKPFDLKILSRTLRDLLA